MFDFEIAYFLYKISKLLAVFEENKYRSRAYYKAAMAVDAYDKYVSSLAMQNMLSNINGIGESSAKLIKEIVETGKCELLAELENRHNVSDYSLLLSHGLSDKLLKKLFGNGICTFAQLEFAIKTHQIVFLSNTESIAVRNFVSNYSKANGRYLFPYAYCLCSELVSLINQNYPKISVVDIRWNTKVEYGQIQCLKKQRQEVTDIIKTSERYNFVDERDNTIECLTRFGLPIKIIFTSVFNNDNAEIKLNGDLHTHTVWSDGKHSIEEMAKHAKLLGHDYIGITDHSYSLRIANGMSEVDAKQQIEEIRSFESVGIKVFAGIEVEVLKDGSLDYPDALLSQFDYVIAGIHSHLNQDPTQLQDRIEKALSNPYVSIFAHPSARLLGRAGVLFSDREPYAINIEKIIEVCKQKNVAIEFNAFPERFDVAPEYFCKIADSGIMLSVGTDSHSIAHLNCIKYAKIALAACPKLKSNILNCLSAEELMQFFEKQRISKNAITDKETVAITKNFEFFFSNNQRIMLGNDVAIGIDLTGSETKPSGWSAMRGNNVETAMLYCDDDLIQASLKYKPKIVSIDSPLSYPEGRCCTKETCACKKKGITRYCERLLSAFGIGVYPCLIPSMVNLTTRGMQLAQKFRDLGIEVIESYPGVAQDVLNIRRKQNGLQHLKNSYKNFGIVGDYFSSDTAKHDELDAIASALVGLFYLNGQYVALGNEKENFLIVPNVTDKPKVPFILGLTGTISAGKTTLAEYLKFKYGFKTLRYSQIICDLYNCESDRKTLQTLGAEIAKDSKRQKELSLTIINRIETIPTNNYVVEGIRHELDYETLKNHFDKRFEMIYVDVNFTNAFNRYNKREREIITKDEFKAKCNHESEQNICMLRLKYNCPMLENNKTYKDFFEKMDIFLNNKEKLWQ
jgi:histidinol phosphatase-like PHP family hydrolase/predicted nuclease with RNAse H fold/dephospho-CoA kinase